MTFTSSTHYYLVMEEKITYTVKGSSDTNRLNVTFGSFNSPSEAYDFIKLCFNESLHNKESYYNWTKYIVDEEQNGKTVKEMAYTPDYKNKKLLLA